MSEFTIREFVPQRCSEDFGKLLPAYLEIWNDRENLKYLSFTLKEFSADIVSFWFSHHQEMGGRYFVTTDVNELITGIAVVKESPVEGFEISGFAVRPGFKNRGAGKQLLQYSVDAASDGGFHALHGGVFTNNKPMLSLLIRNDFIPTVINNHACDDGRDIMFLKRYLM